MSTAFADAIRKSMFAYMNNEKANNITRTDCSARRATSYCQDIGAAADSVRVVKGTVIGAKCTESISQAMKSTQTTSKLFDWGCKGAKIASKAVNPILTVASGIRVFSAEDKKTATIQEGLAMGSMFGVESLMKSTLGLDNRVGNYAKNKILNTSAKQIKFFISSNKWLSKLPTNKVTGCIKAVAFVVGSTLAFAAGKELGKMITSRTTEKSFEQNKLIKEKEQLTELLKSAPEAQTNLVV